MKQDQQNLSAHQMQPSEFRVIPALEKAAVAAGKMKVVTLETDHEFRDRVRHVLKPHEPLMEFVARTGLAPVEAAKMSRDQITRFVEQAERNRADEMIPRPRLEFPPPEVAAKAKAPGVTSVLVG